MLARLWKLISMTFQIWAQAKASRMSAAMTYFTMLSLAPLLVIAIAIAGFVYDGKYAEQEIIQQVSVITTPAIAETVAGLIKNATKPGSGLLASSISLLVLFYGASGVFSQLYDTFNDIWHIPPETRSGILFGIQKRLIGVAMVLLVGVLLIATLSMGSAIAFLNRLVNDSYPQLTTWLNLADRSLTFLLMPFVFSMVFRFVPATRIQWRDVWLAGILTAMLIAASRYLIDYYLKISTASEVYGAAGSLVILLIWVYMTGLVVFFGASFSHAWAETFGSRSGRLNEPLEPPPARPPQKDTPPMVAPSMASQTAKTDTPSVDPPAKAPPLNLQRRSPGV